MARTITWKNDDNATCKLTIQDGNNTEVALTPAAEPFTTAMQETDDLFTPIRTSSGYANVLVDSVDDIAALVGSSPLARKVLLTVDGATRWVGFLACETFSQSWDKGPIEIELPVMSPIEMLRGLHPSASLSALKYINFAQLLVDINTAVGNSFEQFYFPALSNVGTTLKYQFDMKNYATSTEHNTEHEMASYYEILEDVCKLFGWQCIEYGSYLVFLAADVKVFETGMNNVYQGFSLNNIRQIAAGQSATSVYRPAFTSVISTIDGADHSQTWIAGKKSVEVSGDLNERSETIWEMDVFQQCKFKGNNYHDKTGLVPIRYTVKKMGCISGGNIAVYNNVFSGGASSPDTDGNNIKYVDAFTSSHNVYGASITYEQMAEYSNTLPFQKIVGGSLDYYQRLIIKPYSEVSVIVAKISTNFWYDPTQNKAYNAFRIAAAVRYATEARKAFGDWSGDKYIEMSLVIRTTSEEYYYDKTKGWNTEGGTVQIYCSNGKIDEASYNSIPAPTDIAGEVLLYIWASTSEIGSGYMSLEDLSIQLYAKEGRVRGKASPRIELRELRTDKNVKKIDITGGFTDVWSQSCGLTLAQEPVPDSYGVVLASDKTLPASLYSSKYPEDALADRVHDYYQIARTKIQAVVHSAGVLLSPFVPYTFISGGKPYICIEQKMNWKTNELTGGFFETTYNS